MEKEVDPGSNSDYDTIEYRKTSVGCHVARAQETDPSKLLIDIEPVGK